jgi:hypothetical protein
MLVQCPALYHTNAGGKLCPAGQKLPMKKLSVSHIDIQILLIMRPRFQVLTATSMKMRLFINFDSSLICKTHFDVCGWMCLLALADEILKWARSSGKTRNYVLCSHGWCSSVLFCDGCWAIFFTYKLLYCRVRTVLVFNCVCLRHIFKCLLRCEKVGRR